MTQSMLVLVAFIPAMVGPLPAEQVTLTARICGGGTMAIPLGQGEPAPDRRCDAKGCHAGTSRKKSDLDR